MRVDLETLLTDSWLKKNRLDWLSNIPTEKGEIINSRRKSNNPEHFSSIHSKSWRPWRPVSANFFHFPPKFRLRTWKPSRLNCTNASPSVCRLCFVFNIPTSYIDLLYFDNLLLKTPDLCNLRTFVAIFFVAIYALFPPIFGGKKTDSANLSAFRMYGKTTQPLLSPLSC